VADLGDAYHMLAPLLGTSLGQHDVRAGRCSSRARMRRSPATLAARVVMEGFLSIRLRPWLRRLITRLIAIVPAVIVLAIYGESGTGPLLILSQVILSLQLSFAVFPLVMFTGRPGEDGGLHHAVVDARAGVARRRGDCRAELLAALPDDRGLDRRVREATVYRRILVAIEHSSADATIVDHVRELARPHARPARARARCDGWVARKLSIS